MQNKAPDVAVALPITNPSFRVRITVKIMIKVTVSVTVDSPEVRREIVRTVLCCIVH